MPYLYSPSAEQFVIQFKDVPAQQAFLTKILDPVKLTPPCFKMVTYGNCPALLFPAYFHPSSGSFTVWLNPADLATAIYSALFLETGQSRPDIIVETEKGEIRFLNGLFNAPIALPDLPIPANKHNLAGDHNASASLPPAHLPHIAPAPGGPGWKEQKHEDGIRPYTQILWDCDNPFSDIPPISEIETNPLWPFHQALVKRILARGMQNSKETSNQALWALAVIKSLIEVILNKEFIIDAIAAFNADLQSGAYFANGSLPGGETKYSRKKGIPSDFKHYREETRNAQPGDENKGHTLRTSAVKVSLHNNTMEWLSNDLLIQFRDRVGLDGYMKPYIEAWESMKNFSSLAEQDDCLDAFIDNIKVNLSSGCVNERAGTALITMLAKIAAKNTKELHRADFIKELTPIAELLTLDEKSYSVESVEKTFNQFLEKYENYTFYENKMVGNIYVKDTEGDVSWPVDRERLRKEIVNYVVKMYGEEQDDIDRKWPVNGNKNMPNDEAKKNNPSPPYDASSIADQLPPPTVIEKIDPENAELQRQLKTLTLQYQAQAQELQREKNDRKTDNQKLQAALAQQRQTFTEQNTFLQRTVAEKEATQAALLHQQRSLATQSAELQQLKAHAHTTQQQVGAWQQQCETKDRQLQEAASTINQWTNHCAIQAQQSQALLQTELSKQQQQSREERAALDAHLKNQYIATEQRLRAQHAKELQEKRIETKVGQLNALYKLYETHLNESYEVDDSLLSRKKEITRTLRQRLEDNQYSAAQRFQNFKQYYEANKQHLEQPRDNLGTYIIKGIIDLVTILTIIIPPARRYFIAKITQVEGQKVARSTDTILDNPPEFKMQQ